MLLRAQPTRRMLPLSASLSKSFSARMRGAYGRASARRRQSTFGPRRRAAFARTGGGARTAALGPQPEGGYRAPGACKLAL
eukprot:477804-Pleurochrysis_carterae.AAC.1